MYMINPKENSGEVIIEGENYEVVDECTEEEDVAQFKNTKNADVEQEAMDVTQIASGELNNSTEQNEAIKIKKNDDTTKEKTDEMNTDKNNIAIIEKNDVIIAERNEDTSTEKDKDTKMEKKDNTNSTAGQSNDTNIEENNDTKVEKNNDTNAENDIMIIENVSTEKDKDTDMKNVIITIEDDKEALTEHSTDNTLSSNKKSDNVKENTSDIKPKCSQQLGKESIDADVNIIRDQSDHKNDADEDVLHHLDEIENIVLDSVDSQLQEENQSKEESIRNQPSNSESNKSVEKTITNENLGNKASSNTNKDFEVKVKVDESSANDWYDKKFIQKEIIIKERLTKVARVLGISYPCYEKWLEYQEKVNGSPLCTLKPSRRCCLDKPYTNRWKFICNKKKIYDLTTEVDNCDTFFNKTANIVWKLEPSNAWGVNPNNKSEFPPFVLRAVKIFEDFLQTTEELNSQNSVSENFSDDVSIEMETKTETNNEDRQDWLWLVVRCNSMDELMLFATGENISRSTMDRLKQVYETGTGKDCNVKSLYCKSTNKYNGITVTDTTFLVGSEALDEIVGGLKVQLAPKTNFWSNAAGAENVANAVMDFLAPTTKTTVLEIGCGIGLIGLMMASKCQQVIGVDSPSEVEEAELTCELNNIKNASFIMGSPTEVTPKIIAAVKNRKTYAVVNANTNIGRAIEVMTCLRQISSLEQIVMISTLTKQSVRAILELVRPGVYTHGSVFIPVSACVVDTLPIGSNFEAVILLQRKMMNKLNKPWLLKHIDENVQNSETKHIPEKLNEQSITETDKKTPSKAAELETKKYLNKSLKKATKKSKILMKKAAHSKNVNNSFTKNKFKGKRAHSPDKGDATPKKVMKKFNKFGVKPWHTDATAKKKKEWNAENPQLRFNPLYEKKMREHKEQTDLRKRLSNNRLDTDIAQTVKKHQALLEMAKEKLSGPSPTVDVNTAKQLQSMLNMVLEQTNKLQSQLPCSVWDRIAPPENVNANERVNKQDDTLLKGRYVQEIGSQDIVIITPNKEFLNNEESVTKPIYKKYNNLLPLEPNTIMPVGQPSSSYKEGRSVCMIPERFHETNMHQQQIQENSWNRNKTFERNRWNEIGNIKKSISPIRRQNSPPKYCITSAKRPSPPKRPLLSPPRRLCSPPRRHFSPLRHPMSSMYRQRSPVRRQMSPLRTMPPRRMSPSRRSSSPRRLSPLRRGEMTMNRPVSPISSPIKLSPKRSIMSPPRRQASPMERPMSPMKREIPSPNTQEMILSRRQTMAQERHQTSMPRRQQSPQRKQIWPQKFTDNWDIPSRRAIEQSTWARPMEQNMWRTEKASSNNTGEQMMSNDRRRKTLSQEKWENVKTSIDNDAWDNSGNTWNSKQMSTNPMMKETWSSSSNSRWLVTSNMPGSSKDWYIRGKESFTAGKEPWVENKQQARWESLNFKDTWKQSDKEELNDLPEDAKDPWGDDGISDLKERWLKFESTNASSSWMRQNEQQSDPWTKHKDNWQNKGVSYGTKSQWQNNGVGESRWLSQNEVEKKASSSGWQNGNTVGSWQFQHSNFQSQRPFSGTQFKDL
ncbi:unnamed protein product [Xylocopa violacea]|uniref:tRNA (uracil(54)-C(5))-methyltransferase n=1 Tax=Xylocopa violacea TaxID=135666 RepID=A0ABP1NW51_XYLVO